MKFNNIDCCNLLICLTEKLWGNHTRSGTIYTINQSVILCYLFQLHIKVVRCMTEWFIGKLSALIKLVP